MSKITAFFCQYQVPDNQNLRMLKTISSDQLVYFYGRLSIKSTLVSEENEIACHSKQNGFITNVKHIGVPASGRIICRSIAFL